MSKDYTIGIYIRLSISTAPTIRATVGVVLPPTMSEWIFWNRLCLARYGA